MCFALKLLCNLIFPSGYLLCTIVWLCICITNEKTTKYIVSHWFDASNI